VIHLHHFIEEIHSETRCPYCNKKHVSDPKEEFFGPDHYHVWECECGKVIRIKQKHYGSGDLEKKL